MERATDGTTDHRAGSILDLRPLAHPLWWLAVAVLALNDNVLKGGGVVPGWLTGKLSDLAFLIVAPVLLGCLLPAALPWRRVVALGAVAAVYVAQDLSATVAGAIVALAGRIGLYWGLWPDVTDLAALVVLPVAWGLLGRPPRAPRRALQPLGVLVGMFVCLATSDLHLPQYPFLVNRSDGPVEARLTWLQKKVSCDADLAAFAATLSLGDLGSPDRVQLARGEVAALNAAPAPGASSARTCQNPALITYPLPCSVVLVDVKDGPSALARALPYWEDATNGAFICPSGESSRCRSRMDPGDDPGHGALSVVGRRGQLMLVPSAEVEMVAVDRAAVEARGITPESCEGQRQTRERLVASAGACAADTDCAPVSVPAPLRQAEKPCFVYADESTATGIRSAHQALAGACGEARPDGGATCPVHVQPGACRAGRCVETCPGQGCVRPCGHGEGRLLACRYEGETCSITDTHWCRCESGRWRCDHPSQIAGSCLASCVEVDQPLRRDGGAPDAGPTDAGAVDGRPD